MNIETLNAERTKTVRLPAGLWKYLSIWVLIALIMLRAGLSWISLPEKMERADNDDLLRMVMVRDWLAGQSWFDTQQYRLLPPEGVSIHWSRYIDAAIGGIISLASLVLSVAQAEQLALLLWPTILLIALLALNAAGTRRVAGPVAAIGAMVCTFLWTRIAEFEFAPGRIDHHNVQIVLATIVFFSLILPLSCVGARILAGVCGGLAAALSFAVGLEMLPVILLLWAAGGLRFAFAAGKEESGSGAWLVAFALTLSLAAPLAMAGQVPQASWLVPYCDALAPPLLSLLAVGVVVSVLPVLGARWLSHALTRIAAMAAIFGLGVWLAAPLLGPCLAGPYGAMSAEARAVITERVGEAQPALAIFLNRGASFDFLLLFGFLLLPVATLQAFLARNRLGKGEGFAVGIALLIGWLGILVALTQIRAFTLAVPVIPFLTGFALREIIGLGRDGVRKGQAIAILAGLVLMTMPAQVMKPLRALVPSGEAGVVTGDVAGEDQGAGRAAGRCRDATSFSELDNLPPSLIASTGNFGTPLLYFTPHSATAAPYHRSGAAFWNGVGPFREEAQMLRMLESSGADYVILCRGQADAASDLHYAQALLDGTRPAWLVPVDPSGKGEASEFLVLRVQRPLP